MAKRNLLAAVAVADTFPSPSPRRDEEADIPAAKMPRLTVPFSANPEEYVTKTASSDAEEAVRPADADPMTGIELKASAKRAPPNLTTLEYDKKLNDQRRNHNRYNDLPAVAPMAPAPTNMQLRRLSGWRPSQPSNYPTTGFTGTSVVDQVNIQQTLYGVNGHASTAIRHPSQTRSPRSNGWNPWGSTWHRNITPATGMMDQLGMRIADQVNILQILNGVNGHASPVARGPGQTAIPRSTAWNPRSSAWQPTISQVTGQPGMQTAVQGIILETQQDCKNWDASLALDMRQPTTDPCRNRMHTAMGTPVHTPVDRAIGRKGRLTAEEAEMERTTGRKGKWTADEDKELTRAVEKFSVTRWKQIAELIPGRTKKQCWNRWQYALDPSVVRMTERTGKWLREEDDKLVAAAVKYKGKNWDSIAALVPSRTKRQCMDRWHKCKSGALDFVDD
jgi:hypothetical protein